MEPIIEIESLSKTVKGKPIITDLNLQVYAGDIFGLFGPVGAGKTTTVKMVSGIIAPTQGRILINGCDIRKEKKEALKSLGAVIEPPKFYRYLSGYNNLAIYANRIGSVEERIAEALEIVGLTLAKDNKVSIYSLCMKQRLAIARAFLKKPKILILDEPINGLDLQGVIEIRNIIKELAFRENITFFLTSHIREGMETLCNRSASIYNGRIEEEQR